MPAVEGIIILAWPTDPTKIGIDQVTDRDQRKKVGDFIVKCRMQRYVSLDQLIKFAKRDNTPSIRLTRDHEQMLTHLFTHRCRQPVVEAITKRLDRPLSLYPHFLWSEQILFGNGGEIFFNPTGANVKRIRQDLANS